LELEVGEETSEARAADGEWEVDLVEWDRGER
jgi:hypothetical protein